MVEVKALAPEQLYQVCDPDRFSFETTADLDDPDEVLGQKRALEAIRFAVGMTRAGMLGGIAAWLGFTMPSAIALIGFAYGVAQIGNVADTGWLHGLKVVAVAVVAHAVWGMARSLCPDPRRAGIALAAVFTVVLVSGPLGQVAAIRASPPVRAVL